MKIAIATKDWLSISGHAGQARCWLVYDFGQTPPAGSLPQPQCVELAKNHGAEVLLTGETDPTAALTRILAGEALPDQRFDVTTALCKLRDLFSRH
jgi:hypothetical protein